ncbi:hypothetical protein KR074_003163 [Drosophila pseudoananassae]|nr:hypothetical protein KR074_003163 [Drosophila pseudoananassae]
MWYSTGNNHRMALISQGYKILAEYRLVQDQLKNIYAIPSYASGLHWFGVIFVHSGIYAGSMFRFSILLPENFPDDTILPTVIFNAAVFHPHICPHSKSLDLGPCFKEWCKDQHHIWHLLRYIQAVFADPEGSICTGKSPSGDLVVLDEANNMEALNMLAKSRPDFIKRIQELAISSRRHMYDKPMIDDPHYIIVEPYCAARHLKFMEQLKSPSWREATCEDDCPPAELLGHIESSRQLEEDEANQRVKLEAGTTPDLQQEPRCSVAQ